LTLVLATGLGACGGSDESGEKPPPPARAQDFPRPEGKTLGQMIKRLGEAGPVLSPSVSVLEPGENRFGFGLFDRARRQLADAPVALYIAPAENGTVRDGKVSGPFLARYESLAVKSPYQSKTVAQDDDTAKSVYVADIDFPKDGQYAVLGVVRLDDRLVGTGPVGVEVKDGTAVPGVGDPAPRIDTPTTADVGGDLKQIDTRVPPSTMHERSFKEIAGRRPAVLLFATPALCQSRVCGPVVDIAEQAKAENGEGVEFVHQEIFQDNEIKKGCLERKRPMKKCFREQVIAFKLPTEPWLFTIDADGRVAARIEGAFSAKELEQAIEMARQ